MINIDKGSSHALRFPLFGSAFGNVRQCFEVGNLAETNREGLLADFTSVIYSICAKLYGQRRAKIKAETILKQVEEP